MKQQIRLTESELRHIISESVKKIISEVSFEKAHAAALSAADPNRNLSIAKQRRAAKNRWSDEYEHAMQAKNLNYGAVNSFNREYGKNLTNIPYGDATANVNIKHAQKPAYGMKPTVNPSHYDTFESEPYNRNTAVNKYRQDYNPSARQGYNQMTGEHEYNYYPKAGKRGDDALKNSFNKWHDDYYGYEDD